MVADVLREVIFLTSYQGCVSATIVCSEESLTNVLLSSFVGVNMIFGVHKPFGFLDRNIDFNPTLCGAHADALARQPTFDKPISDSGNGII